jgi:hypothetical protein
MLKFKWAAEKKHEAFNMAVRALAKYEIDATDSELQKLKMNSQIYKLRPETIGLVAKSYAFVRVHFSEQAYKKFTEAMGVELSEGKDNVDFQAKVDEAVKAMGDELLHKSWLFRPATPAMLVALVVMLTLLMIGIGLS